MTTDTLRLIIFFSILMFMITLELLIPRRPKRLRNKRWVTNLSVTVLNSLIVKLILPAGLVGISAFVASKNFGFWNWIEAPLWVSILPSLLLLDCLIYFQHVIFHRVPILWRIHRMHHADLDLDVTSGARFHPIEICLSLGIKIIAIAVLGIRGETILVFEILLNGLAMFNHSNIKLPDALDRFLRFFVITPDVHRIHHSVYEHETNSNYGFNLIWWDKIFRTYVTTPKDGQVNMVIGLQEYQAPKFVNFFNVLLIPFREVKLEKNPSEDNNNIPHE